MTVYPFLVDPLFRKKPFCLYLHLYRDRFEWIYFIIITVEEEETRVYVSYQYYFILQ